MFDLDTILYIIIGAIFFILFGAMVGAIVYLWMAVVPVLAKLIWTIIIMSLMLVFIAITLVVID